MSSSQAPTPLPLLVLGDSRRRLLIEGVTKVVTTWHADWCSEGVEAPIVELTGSGMPPPRAVDKESVSLAAVVDGDPLLYAYSDADFARALCVTGSRERLAMPGSARGRLEGKLTGEAVQALCLDLVRAALPSEACSVPRCEPMLDPAQCRWGRRGTGLTIRAGGSARRCSLELSAAPRLVDALLGRRPRSCGDEMLVGRRQAAEDERVRLTATLGSASVSWSDLRSLCVGDAILLDQPLEAPCTLSVGGSRAVAEAHLGRAEGSLAIQVTRILAAPHDKRGPR